MNTYLIIIILFIIRLNKILTKIDEYIFKHEKFLLIDLNKLKNNIDCKTFNQTDQVFYFKPFTDLAIKCPICNYSKKVRWMRYIYRYNKPYQENIEIYENKNRIFINKNQILLIRNLDLYDTGFYYCSNGNFNSIKIIIVTLLEKLPNSHVITNLNQSYYKNHFNYQTAIKYKKPDRLNFTDKKSSLNFYQIWNKWYSCSDVAKGFRNRVGQCYTKWANKNPDYLFDYYISEWPCNSFISFNHLSDWFIETIIRKLSFLNDNKEMRMVNYLEYELCHDSGDNIKVEQDEIVSI